MSQDESCQDRQNNELEVLKSIYGDQLRDLRKNKQKKKWLPLDIVITLTPQRGMSGPAEVHAQVDLHVTCKETYPQEVPKIQLQNSRGLSDQQLAEHLSELENLAKDWKGEVIYELCQYVEQFLHKHNKPGYSSFYEEMVLKKQEREKCEMEEKQLKEDKERQVLQDEILKRREAFKAEKMNRRESTRISLESNASILSLSIPSSPHERTRTYSRRRCMSTSESSAEGVLCEHRGIKLLNFDSNNKGERQVHRGKCLGHSTKGSVVYAGIDMLTGELFAVTEWALKSGGDEISSTNHDNCNTSDRQHSMKQVAGIEQELNHLYRLHHSNLVQYLNMKFFQDKDKIFIYILQEFVVGTTCSFFLRENIPVDTDMLRYLAVGILTGLAYLHENNVVHKSLRDSSVHIDRTGLVKLSDYSLDKRLSDIYQSSCLAKNEHDFPSYQGRGGKKADIYKFGILLLSLVKGYAITDEDKDKEVNSLLQQDLKDLLENCLGKDERTRWSAEQLLEHCFIRTPLERGLSPPQLDGDNKQYRIEPEQEPDADIPFYLPTFAGQSRILNEFELLKFLGKGAFGDVVKAKNKLDGNEYAIKRIKLNPKNKQLNKKITREVKLLSRLNHENVVRYYNSWIENVTLDDSPTMLRGRFSPSATPSIPLISMTFDEKTEFSSVDDRLESANVENLAPPMHDVEWNISSRTSVVLSADSGEENSDSDSDDEDWQFLVKTPNDESDSIEFQRDGTSQTSDSAPNSQELGVENCKNEKTESDGTPTVREIQCLYIQMEFCEKSTLRTAIDNGLYEDEERIWRLFREIVEGLAHIHQQGMIHRDLKPVNIFLDSNDHVKIGDFGLATTNILSTLTQQSMEIENKEQQPQHIVNNKGVGSFDESMTGQVGTAMYVAPELSSKAPKVIYNQKVDIYSLGIIFFEMCYKTTTGMERVKVLHNIRSKEINLPVEMEEMIENKNKVRLLRWLLNHEPSLRPTSQELLASEYLPPLQLEEAELQEMIRHTLSNAQSKAYKYLVACCFSQEVTPAEDITYDMSLPSVQPKFRFFQEHVKSKVVEIFQKHGGLPISTPLMMPKSGSLYSHIDSCARLMTRTGSVVSVPHDLRAPFARYVAWNNISSVRRYAIERVYREKKAHGFHPRELYECAFDIVGPMSKNLMAEAELLTIAWRVCNEIPQLRDRNFTVRINHTSLLQSVLMHCDIEREKYQDIYSILCDARDGKFTRFQLKTHLISLCLSDASMDKLSKFLETESSVTKIASVLKSIAKRQGEAAHLAKEGLREIEIVKANAEALGVKWPITVVPLLVHNIQQYSGIIYQVTGEKKKLTRGGQDVIAAGGRYDKMLASFRKVLERTGMANKENRQYGAGISISLDKIVCAASETSDELICRDIKFGIDVAVCCVDGVPRREKELAEVLRELWILDLRVTCLDLATSEEIFEYCRENEISHVVLLKSAEKGILRIEAWERDRFQERKISIHEVAEYFQRQAEISVAPVTLNRSESKPNTNLDFSTTPKTPNINYVFSDKDKLSGSARKSYKNSMLAQMSSFVQRISHKVPIEVFAVFLDMTVVRTITNYLEIDEDDENFQKSVQVIIDKHPRHKKYIEQICDEMWEARKEKSRPVLILYSLLDSRYMTLM